MKGLFQRRVTAQHRYGEKLDSVWQESLLISLTDPMHIFQEILSFFLTLL